MLKKQVVHNLIDLLVISLLLLVCFLPLSGAAEEPGQADNQGEAAPPAQTLADVESFEYVLEGRPDPFVPFIEPEVVTKLDPNEIVDEGVVLTGMQLFEPGQLKLVAVMFAGASKMAMVEDVTGKGYVVNEGVLIGRHGVVSQIQEDKVIITETARTRAGKEIKNTVVMRLNKEGDK